MFLPCLRVQKCIHISQHLWLAKNNSITRNSMNLEEDFRFWRKGNRISVYKNLFSSWMHKIFKVKQFRYSAVVISNRHQWPTFLTCCISKMHICHLSVFVLWSIFFFNGKIIIINFAEFILAYLNNNILYVYNFNLQ